jgi:hypothetical protein
MPQLIALSLLPVALAGAAETVRLTDLPAAAGVEAALALRGVPVDGLVARPAPAWRGRTRLRLDQHHHGVPVIGGGLVAQSTADGRVQLAQGRLARPTVDVHPTLSARAAADIARARVPEGGEPPPPTLAVLPDGGAGRLVWQARVPTPGLPWRVLVDAHDGRVRVAAPLGAHALGRVFGNRAVEEQIVDVELAGLPEDAADLDGGAVRVRSRGWESGEPAEAQHALADEQGDFLFDPSHPHVADPFAEVNAWWHTTRTHAYFAEVHGHPVPERVDVMVNHTGSPGGAYDNAFFTYGEDGQYTLTFGQGEEMDWSYDPGIIIHEFGHGVVDDLTGMLDVISYPMHMDEHGLHPAPGGLTEGLPDYWSTTRNDRSTQAEFADGTPIRDSDNDARVPESVLGEAHQDGVVIGGATWELREALGAAITDQLVYGATGLVGSTPTYADFAAALEAAAAVLVEDGLMVDEDLALLVEVLESRGLRQAGRAVPATPDATPTMIWMGSDVFGSGFCEVMRAVGVPLTPPFQHALEVPAAPAGQEITGLTLRIDTEAYGGGVLAVGDLYYDAVVARGEPVRFSVEPVELLGATWSLPREPQNAAWTLEREPEEATLSASDLGERAFTQGETLHLALPGTNCRTASLRVTPEWHASDTPPPAAEAPKAGGGCGGAGGAAAVLLPLGLLGLRRRMSALTQ